MIQKFFLSNINHLQVGDLAFGPCWCFL